MRFLQLKPLTSVLRRRSGRGNASQRLYGFQAWRPYYMRKDVTLIMGIHAGR